MSVVALALCTGCTALTKNNIVKTDTVRVYADGHTEHEVRVEDQSKQVFGTGDLRGYHNFTPISTESRAIVTVPVIGIGSGYVGGGYVPPVTYTTGGWSAGTRYPDQYSPLPGANYAPPPAPVYGGYTSQHTPLPGANCRR